MPSVKFDWLIAITSTDFLPFELKKIKVEIGAENERDIKQS